MKMRDFAIGTALTLLVAALFSMSPGRAWGETLDIPLYKLAPVKNVTLKCIKNEHSVTIPIPERWRVDRAVLTVSFVNSINLIGENSQLVVKVNGTPMGQARLDPLSPEGMLKVSIPGALLAPGYNDLSFQVAQHYRSACEHPCSPDLWTTIKMDQAMLHLEYGLKPVPLKLSKLSSFVYDPKLFTGGDAHMVIEDQSSEMVTTAGAAASGIAKKFDYRDVVYSTSGDLRQGVDNVLIGRKEFVEGFLAQKGIAVEGITGPFLKILHLPRPSASDRFATDPYRSLLVISGLTHGHVKLAAETLAFMNFPYPGTDQMIVEKFKIDDINLYGGLMMLQADKIYRLKSLGFNTHSFEGLQPGSREITFRLPADFLIKENQLAELKLNFNYGAGMRQDSALNIFLNDTRVRVINFSGRDGDSIEGYKIAIPTYLFKPGTNRIRFAPVLTPQAGECEMIQPESLFLTVYENSTFYLPPMPHYVKMPQLGLFAMNGFPFTTWPDGFESAIYLTSADDETISSALNLIGYITRRNAYPFFGAEVRVGKDADPTGETRDLIVIGKAGSLPEGLLKSAPIKLSGSAEVQYPLPRGLGQETGFARSTQTGGLGPDAGVIMEFQSPYKSGRTVLLMTAESSDDLLLLSRAMMEPAVQGQIAGDLVIVEYAEPEHRVSALDVGDKYHVGKSGRFSLIGYYIYTLPYLYEALFLAVLIAVSWFGVFFLKKVRRKDSFSADESGHVSQSFLGRVREILVKIFIKKG